MNMRIATCVGTQTSKAPVISGNFLFCYLDALLGPVV